MRAQGGHRANSGPREEHPAARADERRVQPRVWPLRLIEFSPAVLLALLLAVWFAVPSPVRSAALNSTASPVPSSPTEASASQAREYSLLREAYPVLRQSERNPDGLPALPRPSLSRLHSAAALTTTKVMASPWLLHDASGALTPFALGPDSSAFSNLRDFEAQTGARVFAFAMPARRNPPVVLSAIAAPGLLTPSETRELRRTGTIEGLRRDFARETHGGIMSSMRVDARNSGGRFEGERRSVTLATFVSQGRFYECYMLTPAGGPDTYNIWDSGGDDPLVSSVASATPADRQRLRTIAEALRGAVLIVGPVDAPPVPMRVPAGVTAGQCAAVTARCADLLAGDERAALSAGGPELDALGYGPTVRPLLAHQFGGGMWHGAAISQPDAITAASLDGSWAVVDPMLYVAVWEDHPDLAALWEKFGQTPLHKFWIWTGLRLKLVLGVMGALLLASLLASPLAFRRERQLTAELEFEREQERIRAEARDKVLKRLSELSRRIDTAAQGVSGAPRDHVASSARDIESTVVELKRILGEPESGEADHA